MGKTNYPIKLRISASTPPFLFFSPLSLSPSFTVAALPCSTDPTLSHIHTQTHSQIPQTCCQSHIHSLSQLCLRLIEYLFILGHSATVSDRLSLSHTTHTHTLSHTHSHTLWKESCSLELQCSGYAGPSALRWEICV